MNKKFGSYKAFGHDLIAGKMALKMFFIIGCVLLFFYLVFATITTRLILGSEQCSQIKTWTIAKTLAPMLPNLKLKLFRNGKMVTASASEFSHSPTLKKWISTNLWKLFIALLTPLPVFLLFPHILKKYALKEDTRIESKHLDGAKLLLPAEYKDSVAAKYENVFLPFGGWYENPVFAEWGDNRAIFNAILLPVKVENTHIGVFGGTQSGKTVLLSQMINSLRDREDIAIILDQKGDYTEKFYNPKKDHILNVLDKRCMGWNFWDDLEKENLLIRQAELEAMGSGLIPDTKDSSNQFFNDAARDVLIGILSYLDYKKQYAYADLWAMINQPTKDIADALSLVNARGHVFISEPGKQSQGVHSVLIQYGRVFEYAQVLDDSNDKFRMQDWLQEGRGYIYLTNYDSIREILRPMISMFINFLSKKILTSRENRFGRRVWIFLDEFGSLHKISTLIDILARGGSKGICVVLATQDRGQVEEVYGKNLTDAIFNSCNSWAALRCKDPATARLIVDRVGEWRYEKSEESISDRFDDGGDNITISSRIKREKLLLDSNIMGQDPLTAYIHVDGCQFAHVDIEKQGFNLCNPAFIPRKNIDLTRIQETARQDQKTNHFENEKKTDCEIGV